MMFFKNMISNKYIVKLMMALIISLIGISSLHAEKPINIGSQKQLLIDDLFFEKSEGISLKVHPPAKTRETILKSEHPWESAIINWFNIIKDKGHYDKKAIYRMWYEAYDIDGWPTGDDTSLCYAESRDGIHWTKPELGLFKYQGSTRNNILFRQIGSAEKGTRSRVHGSGIFIDRTAPAESRYKAISQGIFPKIGAPKHRIAGMYSADGLKWTRYSKPICNIFADSQFSGLWDTSINKYVIFGRVGGTSKEVGRGRAIGRSTSDDYTQFDSMKLVLQTNETDPAESDLYNSVVVKYPYAENIYLMFPSLYQHIPDTLDIRLAVSRDGVNWTRPDKHTPWIPLGKKDDFDGGSLYIGQGIVRHKDELSFYYSGSRLKHNDGKLEKLLIPKNKRLFSRVITQLDRFISAAADNKGGSFTTPLLKFTGNTLKLNLNVQQGGSVRVELIDENNQPIPGYTMNDCIPVIGDSISLAVKWKNGHDLSFRSGKPTRIRVEMRNAHLYSFQVAP